MRRIQAFGLVVADFLAPALRRRKLSRNALANSCSRVFLDLFSGNLGF
ncbi:MAG: hypothetical protein JKX99_08205 [Robiginitomaculum sp.]|nr:hypothetical protein [Robiginitomaculum sp.]